MPENKEKKSARLLDTHVRQQASVFGDFKANIADTQLVLTFLNEFKDSGALPVVVQEQSPDGQNQSRLRLNIAARNESITILSDRINFERGTLDADSSNMETLEAFSSKAATILQKCMIILSKRASRMALVADYFLSDNAKYKTKTFFSRNAVKSGIYKTDDLSEWTWRASTREEHTFGGFQEKINYVTTMNRALGQLFVGDNQSLGFDTVLCQFDVNTYQGNKSERFDSAALGVFFLFALSQHARLMDDMERMVIDG